MALLDGLKSLGKSATELFLGQKRSDVKLDDDAERRKKLRQRLLELREQRAFDPKGPPSSVRTSADEAIARLRSGIRSRQAGAGVGPAGLLAARQGAGQEVAGRTDIERGVTQATERAEEASIDALGRELRAAREDAALDEEERERLRKKGLLPAALGALGSLGGPLGGQLGGVGGQAILTQTGR